MNSAKPAQPKHLPLLELFYNGYETLRRKMDEPAQAPLLKMAPLAFSKWYYTALAADTILSPANIIGMDLSGTDENTEYAYHLRTTPQKNGAKYDFDLYAYSTKAHPLPEDLKTLVDYCTPDRETDAHGFLLPEDREEILSRLSLQDAFYLEYLTQLAWTMEFFLPLPSIHTRRLQPSDNCPPFFAQSTDDMLYQLGKGACWLAEERFTELMDLEEDMVTAEFFFDCLKEHKEIDRIFAEFYQRVSVDISEIWNTPPEQLTEEERSIVSSFLFTGMMLDKWFLMPMSIFFHFIRPIAYTPFHFFQIVNHMNGAFLVGHPMEAELFSPSTYYSLTPLAQELFANREKLGEDRQKMPPTLSYEQLFMAAEQEAELQMREWMFFAEVVPEIIAIKVSSAQDDALWKTIEVGTDMDLHTFCRDLCTAFFLEEKADYLLSLPDENGFPLEYSAKGSKRSLNKTNGKTLEDLPLVVGSRLTLLPYPGKKTGVLLDILEIGKGSPFFLYPRITGQSQKTKEQEENEEFF